MYTCCMVPYSIAFASVDEMYVVAAIDLTLNMAFFIDIILNFFSAFYDSEYTIVDSHKVGN